MKKIFNKLPIMLLLINLISSTNAQNRNYIDSLKILPANPNSFDTIKVVCFIDTLTGICKYIDTAKIDINNFNISVFVNYLIGTKPCNIKTDTLTLGQLNIGYYNLQYKLTNIQDNSFDIDSLNFKVQTAGLHENINTEPTIKIYPNPLFYSSTLFSKYHFVDTEFLLYNIFGQVVKRIKIENSETEIIKSDLLEGIYFYKIQKGKRIFSVGKIIIQ